RAIVVAAGNHPAAVHADDEAGSSIIAPFSTDHGINDYGAAYTTDASHFATVSLDCVCEFHSVSFQVTGPLQRVYPAIRVGAFVPTDCSIIYVSVDFHLIQGVNFR